MDTATSDITAFIMDNTKKVQHENDLASNRSIALIGAHNLEGLLALGRGTQINSVVVTDTPAIAVSLPLRSA